MAPRTGTRSAFKHWCKARGKRTEETNLKYALLAQVVRDGGFKIPVVMRLSMIPGHRASPPPFFFPSSSIGSASHGPMMDMDMDDADYLWAVGAELQC